MHQLRSTLGRVSHVGPGNIDCKRYKRFFVDDLFFRLEFWLLSFDEEREARHKARHLWEVKILENDWLMILVFTYSCCVILLRYFHRAYFDPGSSGKRFHINSPRGETENLSTILFPIFSPFTRFTWKNYNPTVLHLKSFQFSKSLHCMNQEALKKFSFLFLAFHPSQSVRKL